MSTLSFLVNEDAAEVERQMAAERSLALRRMLLGIMVAALMITIAERFVKRSAFEPIALAAFISELGSLCVFLSVPIWFALFRPLGRKAVRYAGAVYLLSAAVMALVDFTTKVGLREELHKSPRVDSPVLLIGLVMFLPALGIFYVARKFPVASGRIGLDLRRLRKEDVIVGLIAGALLGLHLLVMASILGRSLRLLSHFYLVWIIAYEIGFQSLAEELFFRGFVFNYLHNYMGWGMWRSAFVSGVANVVVYLVKYQWGGLTVYALATLFYVLTMALGNALIFRWRNNVISCWVSNVVFSLMATAVVS